MVTIKINIKKHLEQYLRGKFNGCRDGAIVLPDHLDLYHVLFDLMSRRPEECPLDCGTFEIALPDRRCGKDPAYYNYLSERSQRIMQMLRNTSKELSMLKVFFVLCEFMILRRFLRMPCLRIIIGGGRRYEGIVRNDRIIDVKSICILLRPNALICPLW